MLKRTLRASYDETLGRLPDALKSEGFGVLTEIDVKDTLKAKLGVDFRRYRILGACNPPIAHQALLTTLSVGTMMPCNVIVYEADDGGAVVEAVDPLQSIGATDVAALRTLAQTVHDKLARVIERL